MVQWAFNAALLVTVGIIAGAVIVVAALVAGIYFLVKAFRDETEQTAKSVENVKKLGKSHKDLLTTITDNAAKLRELQMQGLVNSGKMSQQDFDIWKLSEQKKLDLKKSYLTELSAILEANAVKNAEKEEADAEGKIAIENAYQNKVKLIGADSARVRLGIESNYAEEVKKVKSEAAKVAVKESQEAAKNANNELEDKSKKAVAALGIQLDLHNSILEP